MRESVGVLGLGSMGLPMARNLIDAGFEVHGYDIDQRALTALRQAGGITETSAAAVAARCPVVVAVVVDAAQFESAIFGANGALEGLACDSIVISCVTMAPQSAADFAVRLAARGVLFLDAPVSGGTKRAQTGTLAVFAAGARGAFCRAENTLGAFAAHIFHVGEEPGQGSSIKILNQLLCGVHLAATAEVIALAESIGIDTKLLYDVVSVSSGSSRIFKSRAPAMIEPPAEVTSAADLFVKDLGFVLEIGERAGASVPLASAARPMFTALAGRGLGHASDASIVEVYREQRGPARK